MTKLLLLSAFFALFSNSFVCAEGEEEATPAVSEEEVKPEEKPAE